jgi:hypothetical protein
MNYIHDNPVRAMIVGKLNIESKHLDIASKDMNIASKHLDNASKDMNFLNTHLNVVN